MACRGFLLGVAGFVCSVDSAPRSFLEASFAAVMSNLPGRCRFSATSGSALSSLECFASDLNMLDLLDIAFVRLSSCGGELTFRP